MPEEMKRAEVVIHGKVQGVFFRAETRKAVERIGGVTGWVRNRRDGAVEAVFEGEKPQVEAAIKWCHEGSPMAKVSSVDVEWGTYRGEFSGFDITA